MKHILVASPHESFSELLRSSLEETGQYRVWVAHTGKAVALLLRAGSNPGFDLAILDSDLKDIAIPPLGNFLVEKFPDIDLVVIPPENDPDALSLVNFTPHAYLTRPFYLPDLFEKLENLLTPQPHSPPQPPAGQEVRLPAASPLAALSDRTWLQESLQLQLVESLAAGALVFNGVGPLAYTGVVSSADAEHLAEQVSPSANRHLEQTRFVRLKAVNEPGVSNRPAAGFMLFTRSLVDSLTLGVLFDEHTLLSECRRTAASLAQSLLQKASAYIPPAVAEAVEIAEPEALAALDDLNLPELDDMDEAEQVRLSDLINSLPRPDPTPAPPDQPARAQPGEGDDLPVFPWEKANGTPAETAPEPSAESAAPASPPESPPAAPDDTVPVVPNSDAPTSPLLDILLPWEQGRQDQGSEPGSNQAATVAIPSETRPTGDMQDASPDDPEKSKTGVAPTRRTTLSSEGDFDKVAPFMDSDMMPPTDGGGNFTPSFTCILIPRLPHQRLTGELAERLQALIPQSANAFGWYLLDVTVTPEYVQWTVEVPPAVSPVNLIRIIRQRTTDALYASFPYLMTNEEVEDFWAPGYLVVRGTQPPTAELLRDFIRQTRRRQGMFR